MNGNLREVPFVPRSWLEYSCLFRGGLEVREAFGNSFAVLVGRMVVEAGGKVNH